MIKNKLVFIHLLIIGLILFCFVIGVSSFVYSQDMAFKKDQGIEQNNKKAHEGGSLTVACLEDIRTLDPQKVDLISEKWIIEQIYDGLYEYDPNNQIVPVLAVHFPERVGENEYLVQIRPGIKFSDGTELDSNDIVFSMKRILNPGTQCPTRGFFKDLKEVEAVSTHSVKFVFGPDCPDFLELLTRPETRPVSKKTVLRFGDRYGQVVSTGTGPFRLVEWERGVEVILERNYEYKMGHPFIHRLIFRFPNRRVDPARELRRGRIEMIADLSPQEASNLSSKPFLRIESKEGQRICQIYLNVEEYPFDRPGVRNAISLGIDRHEIVMQVFQGFATAAFSCIPSWHRYYDSNPELRAYDPNQAMKILTGEGFTSEFPVSFSLMYTDDRPFRAIADLIMKQLARIGVQVHLVPLAKKDLFDYIYGRNGRDRSLFQAALEDWEDWRGGADAEQFTWRLYHSNSPENKLGSIPHSWEQELVMAIKACHPETRKSLFSSVITQIDQSLVTIYLCYPHRIWAVRNWVKGEFCNSLGNLFLDRVWVR